MHVIASLDKSKYDFALIEVTKTGGLNFYESNSMDVLCNEIANTDNGLKKTSVTLSKAIFDNNEIDVVFPVIHGTGGEDGVLQGFLEMCGIPYVGSGVLSSAVGFDKVISKILFSHENIPQADYLCISTENAECERLRDEVKEKLGYPVFVKPANGGSSVGIYKVRDEKSLCGAVEKAAYYDRKIIIEAFVPGREFECAVIGGFNHVEAFGVGEIVPCNEFYDYNAKYVDEDSIGIIPAPIDENKIEEIKRLAVKAFKAIDGYGLARVDFFMTDEGRVVLNEINTMPGFTSISMYPKLWMAFGKGKAELMTELIELAFQRKENYKFLKDYREESTDV